MATLREIITVFRYRTVGAGPEQASRGVRQLQSSTRQATVETKRLGIAFAGVGTMILQRAAQVGRRLVGFLTTDFARTTDEAAKTSRAIGITVGSFQRLTFAAKINGATQAQLTTGMRTLAKRIRDAHLGLSTAKKAFRDVGISTTDLRNQKPDAIFLRLADRFRGMRDPVQRAALAQELFGRGGLALVNTLAAGSAEIGRLGDKAAKLGIVMDQQAAAKAEAYQDRMLELKSAIRGVRNVLAGELLPQITAVIQRFVKWITTNNNLQRVVNGVKTAAKALGAILGILISQKVLALAVALGRAIFGIGLALRSALLSTGIGILILLIAKAWKQSAELRGAIAEIGKAFGAIAKSLAPVFRQIVRAFMPLVPIIAQILTLLARIVAEVLRALGPALTELLTMFAELLRDLMPVIVQVLRVFMTLWRNVFKTVIIPLIKAVIPLFRAWLTVVRTVVSFFRASFGPLFRWMDEKLGGIGKAIKFILAPIFIIVKAVRAVINAIASAIGAVVNVARKVWNHPIVKFARKALAFIFGGFGGGGGGGAAPGPLGLVPESVRKQWREAQQAAKRPAAAADVATLRSFAGVSARPATRTANVSVGSLSVNVQGTTGMNQAQLAAAVRGGTRSALQDVSTETMRDFRATE